MEKSHKLIVCGLTLYAAMASSAAFAEGVDQKSVAGQDSKMSTQGLKRAQKAEMNKKLLEKKRAEDRAREEAREKSKGKCKGCPEGGVYDQSFKYK